MTMLKDKLTEAINAKNNDVKSFVWKKARDKASGIQEEIRLMDATPEELNTFYAHCHSMLYSTDKVNPGRYVLLDIIKEQWEKCNVEIYLRKLADGSILADGKGYPRHLYCQDVLSCLNKNRSLFPQDKLKELSIDLITGGLPREFKSLSIASVIDGCLDQLGIMDNKHITFSFILNLGVFLTPEEMKEFSEKDSNGNTRSKLEVIKERLNIKPDIHLTVNPKGLNYSELRAMLKLRPAKYSALTTDQLMTLRNKILFKLEQEVNFHISQWEERIRQIELVAQTRGITLKSC